MGGTIRINASLQVTSGGLNYRSQPTSFNAMMIGSNGPTPGSLQIPLPGLDISLAQLKTMGGWCRFQNLDSTNYVTVGIRNTATGDFFELFELLAEEQTILRLSRKLPKYEPLGTGTFSGSVAVLHAKPDTAPLTLLVEAFDA